jgi:ABC-2 type transport system permease protein
MIATVLMVSLRRLLHNRVELLLTFVVPIAFFSIFAIIFGGGGGTTPKIKVVAVDQAKSLQSKAAIDALHEIAGLRFVDVGSETTKAVALNEKKATELVRQGTASMAIVLRQEDGTMVADLLSDTSDQVAPQIVSALVQRALLSVQAASTSLPPTIAQAGGIVQLPSNAPMPASFAPPMVRVVDVLGSNKGNPVVSMYAAGIAVMFLLFGATGGGGALLEERENQTLDRLLTTGLSMDQLLLGKWFYLTFLGVIQVTVMFIWGQLVFGVNLLGHLDGFLIMTLVTSGAAAAFGLLLATLCKTRGQLNGLSVVAVLTMSALGGSMVPRYVMSQSLRDAGLWTFNAWALDGYDKVFWRELPVADLWPQMSVLMLCGTLFLLSARLFAIRWETD